MNHTHAQKKKKEKKIIINHTLFVYVGSMNHGLFHIHLQFSEADGAGILARTCRR
jgi:hypothetical protein